MTTKETTFDTFTYLKYISKGIILLSLLTICLLTFTLAMSLFRFKSGIRNTNKMILLSLSILSLTFIYGVNELYPLYYFDKSEPILRDLLFFICFYFFFQDLQLIKKGKRTLLISLFILLLIIGLSSWDLLERYIKPDSCDLKMISVELTIHFLLVLSFVLLATRSINQIIQLHFTDFYKADNLESPKSIVFVDR